jgi:hypothetical protein
MGTPDRPTATEELDCDDGCHRDTYNPQHTFLRIGSWHVGNLAEMHAAIPLGGGFKALENKWVES